MRFSVHLSLYTCLLATAACGTLAIFDTALSAISVVQTRKCTSSYGDFPQNIPVRYIYAFF